MARVHGLFIQKMQTVDEKLIIDLYVQILPLYQLMSLFHKPAHIHTYYFNLLLLSFINNYYLLNFYYNSSLCAHQVEMQFGKFFMH